MQSSIQTQGSEERKLKEAREVHRAQTRTTRDAERRARNGRGRCAKHSVGASSASSDPVRPHACPKGCTGWQAGSAGLLALPLPALQPGPVPKPAPTSTSAEQDRQRVGSGGIWRVMGSQVRSSPRDGPWEPLRGALAIPWVIPLLTPRAPPTRSGCPSRALSKWLQLDSGRKGFLGGGDYSQRVARRSSPGIGPGPSLCRDGRCLLLPVQLAPPQDPSCSAQAP